MRLKLLIFLFFAFSFFAKSQDHPPIIKNANWVTEFYSVNTGEIFNLHREYYRTQDDTLINGIMYTKILTANANHTSSFHTEIIGTPTYLAAYRNEGKKAFIVPMDQSEEFLWYDFDLEVGDSLHNQHWYSMSASWDENVYVDAIDSTYYCGEKFKRFWIKSDHGQFPCLVEGIGFMGDLINDNWAYFEYYVSTFAWCYDECLETPPFKTCPKMASIKEFSILQSRISPNPVKDILTIELPDLNEKILLSFYHADGRLVLQQTCNGGVNELQLQGLPAGIYVLKLQTQTAISFHKIQRED